VKKVLFVAALVFGLVSITSCENETIEEQIQNNLENINIYVNSIQKKMMPIP